MTDMLFDLSGQVIVITGGGGVLPGALARGLAARGAQVALLGRTLSKAEAVATAIRAAGGRALALAADVTDRAALTAAAEQVTAEFGRVDHLINGAGGNRPGANAADGAAFFDLPPAELRAVFDLNLMGSLLPAQVFGRLIAQRGEGSLLNISSATSFRPLTRVVGYSAAKAGLNNLTQWLALTFARDLGPGLRVNAIAPGFFVGEQNRGLLYNADGQLSARGQAIINHTPMGRFGEAEELLGATVFLLSPAARFVTGVVLPVDGGYLAFCGI
ncbi:MAG: SDR family oxidoreductase [Anaerolineales bacterium]|nr:SDR family oxidoreductase [Anaerolineales bacterium]